MADWIRAKHGVTAIDVVPNASDNALSKSAKPLEAAPMLQNSRLVVYAGTLGLMDDCRQILEMARVLQERGDSDIQIVLIGDGKQRAALQQLAADWNLKNVRFLGLLSREEVFGWISAAECVLCTFKALPVLDTVSPNKLFDAFACGVPVVQTTRGWIRKLVAEENCGLSVSPDDPEAFADAVRSIARDPQLRARLAANSKRLGTERFDRDILAVQMRRALAAAAANGS
jgi:glycosyltransferase involved in cell wall biosynthesis